MAIPQPNEHEEKELVPCEVAVPSEDEDSSDNASFYSVEVVDEGQEPAGEGDTW